ncbi:hypothetical protein, partial [Spirulina sp. 06S082]|uniref:hypothetical protein n=1 Tax=Spirulina sp. 06S082 TaxID=3110248 RepID=UPI002B1EB80C
TGINATEAPRDFTFTLGRRNWIGKRTPLELEFLDIPGGYLSSQTTLEKKRYYTDAVAGSGATIIVVDTIALMHNHGKFNEQINQVKDVTALLKNAYKNIFYPKLVIFVPIKCETYLQEGKDYEDIINAIKIAYDDLLKNCLSPVVLNIAAVIAPVKTVGCVIYSGYEKDPYGGVKNWYLRKTYEDAPMKREYADQPLRYLLRFLLCQYLKDQKGSIWGNLNDILGRNEDLKSAIERFSNINQMNVPSEILQGHHLLKC